MGLLKKVCVYLIVPLVLSCAIFLFVQLPNHSGVQVVSRNYNPVTIKRDKFGIPTIESKTYRDTLYGLGYAQGQDRLWQTYIKKMLTAGRLSEVLGERTLDVDKFMRTLSLERYAKYALDYLDDYTKSLIQAFCDGVNDAAAHTKVKPLEFWVSWAQWENYTMVDVLAATRLISMAMSVDAPYELMYELLSDVFGEEKGGRMFPYRPKNFLWNYTCLNDEEMKEAGLYEEYFEGKVFNGTSFEGFPEERRPYPPIEKATPKQQKEAETPGVKGSQGNVETQTKTIADVEIQGSNIWVIHGNLTTTGKPILANDPHLQTVLPSFWYQCNLRFEGNYFSGAVIAGTPLSASGKTKYLAWGITVSYVDTVDLYYLTTRGDQYLYDGAWREMKKFPETIYIKGKDPVNITIYETHHGVVIDHYRPGVLIGPTLKPKEGRRHAFSWPGYIKNDTMEKWVLNLVEHGKTAQDIYNNFKHVVRPSLFVAFATSEGDIGMYVLGKIPRRRQPLNAMRPQDGSLAENDLLGYIPFEAHPKAINPKKGYIANGNNKAVTDNSKYGAALTSQIPSRGPRIAEMIEEYIKANKKISVEDVKKMQLDTVDILARDVVPKLLKYIEVAPRMNPEVYGPHAMNNTILSQYLVMWDFKTDKDSIAATIFNVWQYFFHRRIVDRLPLSENDKEVFQSNHRFDDFVYKNVFRIDTDELDNNEFCVPKGSSFPTGHCVDLVIPALIDTWKFLTKHLGEDRNNWKWGNIHSNQWAHSFSQSPLKFIFHRSLPTDGNKRTVSVSGLTPEPEKFDGIWGPTLRLVASLKEGDTSYLVLDSGVSGHPLSPHYNDQMKLLVNNEWVELTELQERQWKDVLEIKMNA